ncbi:MAG: [acyl-carrier-protein] S-malonyltransferase [Clostridia bacterium]|nr:[acyl-carrier-protein] S-malonyltransferase [Clostridia bacterium]
MKKIAFLFPGQGSQYVGMGRALATAFPVAAATFEAADKALGYDISDLCFKGPAEKLNITEYTQPAILTVSVACYRVLEEKGVLPGAVAGHSVGEYSALVAAGALDFVDAVKLVAQRGRFMSEAVPAGQGGMAAILGLSEAEVKEVCRKAGEAGVVEAANLNAPGQVVISGENKALQRAIELARQAGAKKAVVLNVSGPFHSSLMAPAQEKLARVLESVAIAPPRLPVVANVSANLITGAADVREALIAQIASPVRWEESIRKLAADGYNIFIEVGPGKVLSGLARRIAPEATLGNVEDPASLTKTLAILGEAI